MHNPINMGNLVAELEDRSANEPLSQDQFENWMNSPVTKRFFRDLTIAEHERNSGKASVLTNPQDALLHTAANEATENVLSEIFNWCPSELAEGYDQ